MMKRSLLILALLLLTGVMASAQKKSMFGRVADSFSNEPIYAHVTLLRPDSTVADTTTARKNKTGFYTDSYTAEFYFLLEKEGSYILRLESEGYVTAYKPITVKIPKRAGFVNIGLVTMQRDPHYLREVTVTATKIKMVMKGDTVVYNADAFQLAQGSMLDALVKQLPGVELKKDGRIYQNGKFVESLLVNGKDFFSGDPKIALDNLPAYMVKDVKVYNKQLGHGNAGDKMEEHLVLDVNLKKQYSIGWIANADLAGGTKHRYSGKVFAMRFSKNSQLSVFGTMNNLSDEQKPGQDSDWNPHDLADGLLTEKKAGISYQWNRTNKKGVVLALHSDATIEHRNSNNVIRQDGETFLTGGNVFLRSLSKEKSRDIKFYWQNKFEADFVNYSDIIGSVHLSYDRGRKVSDARVGNFSADPSTYMNKNVLDSLFTNNAGSLFRKIITNRRLEEAYQRTRQWEGGAWVHTDIFTQKGTNDYLTIEARINLQNNKDELFNHYLLEYPSNATATADYRNRYYHRPMNSYTAKMYAQYNYDICRSFMNGGATIYFTPYYYFSEVYQGSESSLYRLDKLNGWGNGNSHALGMLPSMADPLQSAIDAANSYHSTTHDRQQIYGLFGTFCFNFNKTPKDESKKNGLNIQVQMNFNYLDNTISYYRNGGAYPMSRGKLFFAPLLFMDYSYHKTNLQLRYNIDPELPSLLSMIDVRDDSDPLYISLGNPSLKPIIQHDLLLRYRQTTGYGASMSGRIEYTLLKNQVAMGFVYDKTTGVRTTKPDNVNGNWTLQGGFEYNTPLGQKTGLSFTSNSSAFYDNNVDLVAVSGATSSSRSTVHNLALGEELRLDYHPMSKIQVGTKFAINWTHATSRRTDFETVNVSDFNYGLTGQIELPWEMQLNTDLTMYSRRGYEDSSMNSNELVWNARLAKRLLKGNLTFALDAFDILGNLTNVQRTLNAQGRTETYYNVIPRYAMLHIIYRLNIRPKKK
jgi:hypothetical protein